MRVFVLALFVAACLPTEESSEMPAIRLEGIPCEVSDIVGRRCIGCHADDPQFGAPMALTNASSFAAERRGQPVHELALERIGRDDESRMPPASQEALTDEELGALEAWLGSGAPETDDEGVCGGEPAEVCQDPSCLPCEPDRRFLVHGETQADPFVVPDSGNPFRCVAFRSPFGRRDQAAAWAPIIDDERVVHHWILYRTSTPQREGAHDCNMPLDAVGLMGWAPGTQASVLPDDVGLELSQGGDEWLILEMHYWNAAGHTDAIDQSGVAICTTEGRRKTAGILTFGSTAISLPPRLDTTITGLCPSTSTLLLSEPLKVIATTPHMHRLGTRIVSEVLPAGLDIRSRRLVRVDPWSFDDQRTHWFDDPVMIRPGDAVRTRCVYENESDEFVFFGERNEDEMCFNFALVYPLEALPAGFARTCVTTLGL
ncbi:MAG: hypothetical protein AAGE52_23505 [Myxococcota bacterium]